MQQLRSLAVLLKLVLNTCWVNETKDFKDATGEDKYNSLSISAAYEYPLSKRTTLWGVVAGLTALKATPPENSKI